MPTALLLSRSMALSEYLLRMGAIDPAQNAVHRAWRARRSEEKHLILQIYQSMDLNAHALVLLCHLLCMKLRGCSSSLTQQHHVGANKHLLKMWLPLFSTKEDQFSVSIQPAVGELLMPRTMSETDFCKEQGRSLQNTSTCILPTIYVLI